jgi:hypothetical protein
MLGKVQTSGVQTRNVSCKQKFLKKKNEFILQISMCRTSAKRFDEKKRIIKCNIITIQ